MTNISFQQAHIGMGLPTGWAATTLGELRQDLGKSIEPKAHPDQVYELYSVPSFELKTPEVAAGSDIGSAKRTVERGVVLLCKINPRINRVWMVGDHTLNPKIASTEWIPFFPLPGLEPRFLTYFMQRSEFRDYLSTNVSGVGGSLMRVKPRTIETYPFPLPPLNEQRRIVEKIEELFTKLDAGVRSLKQTQALLKSYRRSVLKAAVEGELSREWREAHRGELEPASELLERILQERREKFAGKKYKEPVSPNNTGLPELPETWCWTSLSTIADTQLGKMLSQAAKTGSGARPYLRNQNVRWGSIDTGDVLTMDFDEREVAKFSLVRGDVLVCEGGEPGRAAVWNEQLPGAMYQKALHRVRIISSALAPEYLVYHLRKDASDGSLERYFTGSTIKHFTGVALSRYAVSLPPLEEQRIIVEEVERRLSVVDKLEATVEENLKQADALRQSILKRAFSGELVPQDPDDEPAGVLLERIREERQATKQMAGKGRRGKTGSTKRGHAEQGGLF